MIMTHTVKVSEAQYVEAEGGICPICEGNDLYCGSVDIEGRRAFQEITCQNCGTNWLDVYELGGYSMVASREHLAEG